VKAGVLMLAAAVARLLLVLRDVFMLACGGRVKAILLVKADVLAWRRVRSVVRRHRWGA
jgi:hypothetical protein